MTHTPVPVSEIWKRRVYDHDAPAPSGAIRTYIARPPVRHCPHGAAARAAAPQVAVGVAVVRFDVQRPSPLWMNAAIPAADALRGCRA